MRLSYPVYTFDNRMLLPAGTLVSFGSIEELISRSEPASTERCSLLSHGSVREDLVSYVCSPPYNTVFSEERLITDVFNLMEDITHTEPVLRYLDFFKENDFYTYRHVLMVFAMSTLLARDLLPGHRDILSEAITGPTHDFGKLSVPLSILKKTSPLTTSERDMLRHHTLAGYVLISYYLGDIDSLQARVAMSHHERKNGSGYPEGILLSDRMVEIVAIVDIYDALVSPRPYRPVSYSNRTAIEEITAMAERGELGWDTVKALVSHNRKDKPHYSECGVSLEKRGVPPPNNTYGITVDNDNI